MGGGRRHQAPDGERRGRTGGSEGTLREPLRSPRSGDSPPPASRRECRVWPGLRHGGGTSVRAGSGRGASRLLFLSGPHGLRLELPPSARWMLPAASVPRLEHSQLRTPVPSPVTPTPVRRPRAPRTHRGSLARPAPPPLRAPHSLSHPPPSSSLSCTSGSSQGGAPGDLALPQVLSP